jgi:quercetin dioxygenase-like cupin family protein
VKQCIARRAPVGRVIAIFVGCGLMNVSAIADQSAATTHSPVHELMSRDLAGLPGKELKLLTVEFIPGGSALPHRHNAEVFVYVLEGAVRMQLEGSPPVTLGPGDTFYEGPNDVHTVGANASPTQPAKILVFMVKNKGQPVSIPVPAQHQP